MNINWFEVFAQMVNFAVLLFVLQKLLYKPLTEAMDERKQTLAKIEEEAERKVKEADATVMLYEAKMAAIEEAAQSTLDNAKREAERTKSDLLKAYREQADEKRQTYLKELEDEKTRVAADLQRLLGKSAVQIAAHILRMTVDESSEEKLFHSFIDKISALKSDFPDLVNPSHQMKLNLVSATEMPMDKRRIFEEALRQELGPSFTVAYLTDRELQAGYELKFETFTLHHNIRKYVAESEKIIMEAIEENAQ